MVKSVLVVGAAGDIGAAIASNLRSSGWRVTGSDLRPAKDWPAGDKWISADITVERNLLWTSLQGPLDGLVVASGRIFTGGIADISESEWDDIFAVNARAAYFLARESLDHMAAHASIVFVGSVAGRRPSPDNLAYGASKAALHSVAASLALALAPRGIRVNAVCPGLIDTGLTRKTTEQLSKLHGITVAEQESLRVAGIPQGRAGSSAEVAEVVAFLLSEQSSYTTGAFLSVSGGVPI